MNNQEYLDKYKQDILKKYKITDMTLEEWIEKLYKTSLSHINTASNDGNTTSIKCTKEENLNKTCKFVDTNEHKDVLAKKSVDVFIDNFPNNISRKNCQAEDIKIQDQKNTKSVPKEVKFHECVRGKKRNDMKGTDCFMCSKYFEAKGDNSKSGSRHKIKYERPKTPPGFWDLDM